MSNSGEIACLSEGLQQQSHEDELGMSMGQGKDQCAWKIVNSEASLVIRMEQRQHITGHGLKFVFDFKS